jgi:hypothetical protein
MASMGTAKGVLTANAVSITNPFSATGSVAVSIGDVVVAVLSEQTSLTVTTVSDNLGNSYTAQNAGTDAGNVTGRAYWFRITSAGTLTSVDATTTGSTDNVVFTAVVYQGPFDPSPLDANPGNASNALTSPFSCPASGALAAQYQMIVAWMSTTTAAAYSATAPLVLDSDQASSTVAHVVIGSMVVSSTASVTPVFSAGSNPAADVLGTLSFKFLVGTVLNPTQMQRSPVLAQ